MTDTLCNCMSEGHQQANDKANKTTKTMTIDEVILAHRHMLTMQIESCFCVKALWGREKGPAFLWQKMNQS